MVVSEGDGGRSGMNQRWSIAGRMMRLAGAIAAGAMLGVTPLTLAQKSTSVAPVSRVMIDRSLSRSSVRVTGYTGASVTYVLGEAWPGGSVRTKQFADVAAIIGVGERAEAPRAGTMIVELVDGTRLLGTLEQPIEGARAAEAGIAHGTAIGDVSFDLDHLSRIVFDATVEVPPIAPGDADVIELANGDRMEGLVATLWPLVVEDAADASKKTELTPDRVRQIVMSNKRRESGFSRVWLRDGSIVNVSSFVKGEGGVLAGEAHVDGAEGVFKLSAGPERVLALVMSGTKLAALSEIPVSAYRPGTGRRWTPGPSVIGSAGALGGDIELCGPLTAEWELPKGAARFSAGVELAPGARSLGACTLVVEWRGKEIASVALSDETPTGEIIAPLEGGEGKLAVRIESGRRGPVQNTVVLRQALVLVERP